MYETDFEKGSKFLKEQSLRNPTKLSTDLLISLSILLTAALLGLPVLQGGYLTYLDNGVHFAELYSLASYPLGWSDLGFCGFPLRNLHSPLWYGLLSSLHRFGLSLHLGYPFFLWFSFAAPSLALYAVTRRRLPLLPSAILSYLLLLQPTTLLGMSSSLGGMWTFSLAVAAFLLWADRIVQPELSLRQHLISAVLLAIIGLSHFFVLVASVLFFVVVQSWHLMQRRASWKQLLQSVLFAIFAAVASASYWLPLLLVPPAYYKPISLSFPALLLRLFLPTDMLSLLAAGATVKAVRSELFYTETILLSLPIICGVLSLKVLRKQSDDSLPFVGALFGALCFALVLLSYFVEIFFLGPVPWRFVYFVRLGMLLSSLALFAHLWSLRGWPNSLRFPWALGAFVLLLSSTFWWNKPLRRVTTSSSKELQNLREMWQWMKQNRKEEWGRVYLQNTFLARSQPAVLSNSHILIHTRRETGLPQLGTYYGVTPYNLRHRWSSSEFGMLFADFRIHPRKLEALMRLSNAGVLLSSSWRTLRQLSHYPNLQKLYQKGRFALWLRKYHQHRWVEPMGPGIVVKQSQLKPGRIDCNLVSSRPKGSLLVKTGWHPWWRVKGASVKMEKTGHGLLQLTDLPVGKVSLTLTWEPPRYPQYLSLFGWLLFLGLWVRFRQNDGRDSTQSSG